MTIPPAPPSFEEILSRLKDPAGAKRIAESLARGSINSTPDGKYRHWETLGRIRPPDGLSSEEWWAGIKLARRQTRRAVPLKDKPGKSFAYSLPDPVLEFLHEIDRDANGRMTAGGRIVNPQTRERHIESSLIEEAIASSQLEGASTTREAAKAMIRSGRNPVDRSERMILNNYRAVRLTKVFKDRPLTPETVFTIHRTLAAGTLDAGADRRNYLRVKGDDIAVYDKQGSTLLHKPPPAGEITRRMAAMCDFANKTQADAFLHPILKAIVLHFWLAYDHPFVDGNGRTARALFYWSALSQGYGMFEFLSISSVIHKAPAQYARSFLYTETDENDLTYFILAQLGVIRRAINALHAYLDKKASEIQRMEQVLRSSVSVNHRQLALLEHAPRHAGMRYTIASHKQGHGVTYQTARTDLLYLASRKLLGKTKMGRVFSFTAPSDLAERLRTLS
jgi:Fic family protein